MQKRINVSYSNTTLGAVFRDYDLFPVDGIVRGNKYAVGVLAIKRIN